MWKNYLKIAFRNLRRHRGYTLLNMGGLAVGLAAALLALLYLRHATSYDDFHSRADQVYRLGSTVTRAGEVEYEDETPSPLASALKRALPSIDSAVRVDYARPVVGTGDKAVKQDRFFRADPSFFEVFDGFSLVKGDPATALQAPRSLVLTERMACRYFGDDDPVGKTLTLRRRYDYTVTGVAENPPANTHLRFDFLASLDAEAEEDWADLDALTYVALRADAAPEDLNAALGPLSARTSAAAAEAEVSFSAQPLASLHLYDEQGALNAAGRRLVLFSMIALFVLLIVGVNYVNLSTARSARRAREIGVRKAAGARRGQLVGQFLAESVLLSLVALAVALLVVRAALPGFNTLAGAALTSAALSRPFVLAGFVAVALIVGLAAGLYPAFVLSGFSPARVLSGGVVSGRGGARLRRGLVVFQFALTIALLAGALVIDRQLSFVHGKDLGFEALQRVALRAYDLGARHEDIKQQMLRHAGIERVAATSCTPGTGGFEETAVRPTGAAEATAMRHCSADADFLSALGIALKEGRGFSGRRFSDRGGAVLINETAARQMGGGALGRQLTWTQEVWTKENSEWTNSTEVRSGRVVGVVEDFHIASLHERVEPLVIQFDPNHFDEFIATIRTDDLSAARAFLESLWAEQAPSRNFEFAFLSSAFANAYQQAERERRLLGVFAGLAILIACLGLFGLAAFAAEQRTKEIGIRKVLGASVGSIVALLSKDFLKLVLVAFVIAAPLAYFVMQRWLEGFAYRIDLGAGIFLLAGAAALFVALLTVSYQAVRAALADPARSLRHE